MSFTYLNYMSWGIVLPLLFMFLLLVCCIICTIVLHRQKRNVFVQVLPIIFFLSACLIFVFLAMPALPFLEGLPADANEAPISDVVLIEQSEQLDHFPIYFLEDSNSFAAAGIIQTNRGAFYCIGVDRFQKGDYMRLTFMPYSRAVLDWKSLFAQEATEYWQTHPTPPSAFPKNEGAYKTARNEAVIQLLTAIVPLILLNGGLLILFGEKYANYLLRTDSFSGKRIKVRLYGIIKSICTSFVFLLLIVYFSLNQIWDLAVTFAVALLGYGWIKCKIYSAKLTYTHRYITFITGRKREVFAWEDVTQMSWETEPRAIAYSLKIQFKSGLIAKLSSGDFVGLSKLKAFYSKKARGRFCVNPIEK